MKAEIVSIGSELVSGQSLDTNSQWLSRALGKLGIATHFHSTIGDDLAENLHAFRVAIGRADLVIATGGLGPTLDDLTREVLAEVAGVGLVEHEPSLRAIEAFFARRNRPMAERNRVQALLPEGAEPLPNPIGTAPGVAIRIGTALVAALPGVPTEMKRMFDEQVVPWLSRSGVATRAIVHRKINMFGRGESEIEAMAPELTARGRVPEVGITASDATISFRVVGEGATEAEARALIQPTVDAIYAKFAELIVGEDADDVAEAAVHELNRAGLKVATAESCTGGLVAHLITAVPGASDIFPGGIISYAVEAKCGQLDVPREMIDSQTAVCADVAAAMASGVRKKFCTDFGLAITGYAGPGEGVNPEQIGLVYVGLATPDEVRTRKLELGPEQPREFIRRRAAKHALNWVRLEARTLAGRRPQ